MGYSFNGWSNANASANPINGSFTAVGNSGGLAVAGSEVSGQIKVRIPGLFSKAYAFVDNQGTARSVTFRKNGNNGNQVVSPTDSTAGVYTDLVNQDRVASTDLIAWAFASSGAAPTYHYMSSLFWADTNHATFYATANVSYTTASTTFFIPITGAPGVLSATNANIKFKTRVGGVLQNAQVYVVASRATNSTAKSQINGVDGTISFTITASVAGLYEDAVNSDTFNSGDDINWSITTGTGVDTLNINSFRGAIVTTSGATNDIVSAVGAGNARAASGTASFYVPMGRLLAQAAESTVQVQHGFPVNTSRFRVFCSLNTYLGNGTARLRTNTGNGNQTFTITLSVPGLFEDSSNTDKLASTDNMAYSIIDGTAGSITVTWWGLTEQDNTPEIGAIYTNTGLPLGLTNQTAGATEGLCN